MPGEPPVPLEGVARQEWDRITSECYWLTEGDAHALADRCLCWARLQEAEADVAKRGQLVGRKKLPNPSTRLARQYRNAVNRYDGRLGLVAAARAGVGKKTATAGEIDALEAALSWPFGFTRIRIWRDLRCGKPANPTSPPELQDLAIDRLECDRQMNAWKQSHGIPEEIDAAVQAPSPGASADEWRHYHLATVFRTDRIIRACRAADLDPYRC